MDKNDVTSSKFQMNSDMSPNLLIIHTDQQSWWTLYGGTIVETPNIDATGREGAMFSNFFANSALCTPSRGCFLTGRYPHTHGAYTHKFKAPDGYDAVGGFIYWRCTNSAHLCHILQHFHHIGMVAKQLLGRLTVRIRRALERRLHPACYTDLRIGQQFAVRDSTCRATEFSYGCFKFCNGLALQFHNSLNT